MVRKPEKFKIAFVLLALTFAQVIPARNSQSYNGYSDTTLSDNNLYGSVKSDNYIPSASSRSSSSYGGEIQISNVIDGSGSLGWEKPTLFHYQVNPSSPTMHVPMAMQQQPKQQQSSGGVTLPVLTFSYGPPRKKKKGMGWGWGWSPKEVDNSIGKGSIGGILGLLGYLGLKGLDGLDTFSMFIPLLPFFLFPFLIPLVVPFTMFISQLVPILLTGRSYQGQGKIDLDLDLLKNAECVEKVACEIARTSRAYNSLDLVESLGNKLPRDNRFAARIRKGLLRFKTNNKKKSRFNMSEADNCSKFACHVEFLQTNKN